MKKLRPYVGFALTLIAYVDLVAASFASVMSRPDLAMLFVVSGMCLVVAAFTYGEGNGR